jgi:hypothetical protein
VDIHERLDWAFSTFSVFNVKDKQKVRKPKYREKVVCAESSAVKYIPGSGPKGLHRSFPWWRGGLPVQRQAFCSYLYPRSEANLTGEIT